MAQIDLGKLKFNWRGAWVSTAAYGKDDVVYLSKVLHTLLLLITILVKTTVFNTL